MCDRNLEPLKSRENYELRIENCYFVSLKASQNGNSNSQFSIHNSPLISAVPNSDHAHLTPCQKADGPKSKGPWAVAYVQLAGSSPTICLLKLFTNVASVLTTQSVGQYSPDPFRWTSQPSTFWIPIHTRRHWSTLEPGSDDHHSVERPGGCPTF